MPTFLALGIGYKGLKTDLRAYKANTLPTELPTLSLEIFAKQPYLA